MHACLVQVIGLPFAAGNHLERVRRDWELAIHPQARMRGSCHGRLYQVPVRVSSMLGVPGKAEGALKPVVTPKLIHTLI